MNQITVFQTTYQMASAPKWVRAELKRILEKAGGNTTIATDLDTAPSATHAMRHKAKDLCTRFGLPA